MKKGIIALIIIVLAAWFLFANRDTQAPAPQNETATTTEEVIVPGPEFLFYSESVKDLSASGFTAKIPLVYSQILTGSSTASTTVATSTSPVRAEYPEFESCTDGITPECVVVYAREQKDGIAQKTITVLWRLRDETAPAAGGDFIVTGSVDSLEPLI